LVEPGHPLADSLEEINKAASRSADLTRQLLTFARRQAADPVPLDLNATVDGMLQMLRQLIGEDVELSWTPGSNPGPIRMDPSQLDQILTNLCVNARDAVAEADPGRVTIETRLDAFDPAYCAGHPGYLPGRYLQLAVRDNGCGMPKETVARLFEPYFTTKEKGKGTGLGLATVYGIVKQNHGFIVVESEPGQGTVFRIYLPLYVAPTGESAPAPQGSSCPESP
ncbi:MAG: hypothetical protein GX548_10825, partial [Lentisphaerae bacterium]|nr:hypothetical protein [Lentisphaerota bacterium]